MKPSKCTPFLSHTPFTAAFSIALFTHFAGTSAFAANSTWIGGYGTTATWNQASQWSEGAFSNTNDVIFNSTAGASGTATFISTGRTVKSITFNGGSPSPAFNIRLATSGGGGTAANLTFITGNTGITIASTDTASHNIGQSDGSIILQGGLPIVHNGTGTLTISRPITDGASTYGVNKSGTGTLSLSSINTYDGQTTINGGTVRCSVGGGSTNSKVVVAAISATHSITVTSNTQTWTCAELAPTAAGKLEFNFGAVLPSTSVSPLTVTGLANFTAATPPVNVVVTTGLVPDTYPLMTWGSTSGTAPSTPDLTVSNVLPGTSASLSITGDTLNLVITSSAASVVKADNALDLSNGLSWVGGSAPNAATIAKWDSTVTSANTTALGADMSWSGIAIENPSGPVTINGGNTLTLGAAALDIDLSTATADLTLACPLAMSDSNSWSVAASRTVTLGGKVSGSSAIIKLGEGTAILSSSANDYTGNTTVSAGTLKLGGNNVIPHGSGEVAGNVVVNGTLDLNGKSDSINGLSGGGVVDNTGAATSTLSVGNNSQTTTFSGVIKSTTGNINLSKTGNGTLTLGGANTFTGTVTLVPSTSVLELGNISPLNNVTSITLGGGTTLRPKVALAVVTAPINLGAVTTTSTITAPNAVEGGTALVPFSLEGAISGAGNLALVGVETTNAYGTIYLKAPSDYTGSTLITTASLSDNNNANIFVRSFVVDGLPATTVLTLDGGDGTGTAPGRYCEFNLGGNNQTLAGLTNVTGRVSRVQRVVNTSTTVATLTVNNSVDCTYSGQLGYVSGFGSSAYNNFRLAKSGSGVMTLAGISNYTGSTTITGGTLALGASNVLPTTPVSIGTGSLSAGAGFAETVGTLDVTAAATINLNTGSTLSFSDSSAVDWTGGSLNLTGTFVSGASLRFGTGTGTGLTPAQLASITATGFTGFALNASGYLTATSSGGFSSWITGTFANGTVTAQGANDDHDKDGISNLVEYALAGQDPTVPNASIGTFAANTLSFTKRAGTSGLTYAIQDSTDLGITDTWAEVTGGSYGNDASTISFTLTPGTPSKNFLRLQVLSN